ncbi:GIY-YIG nuclease family protein [Chitinibacteraceae bacterium HSL-7]
MWWVYVLRCANGSLYTGISNDVPRRWRAHCAGKGARYTRMHRPQALCLLFEAGDKGRALQLEAAFKRQPAAHKHAAMAALTGPPAAREHAIWQAVAEL